jgi:hypothetical protein
MDAIGVRTPSLGSSQTKVYASCSILESRGKSGYWRNDQVKPPTHSTIGDVILPDGLNVNQELVKQGWCWCYRKYAPGDTVLEGLEKEARAAM